MLVQIVTENGQKKVIPLTADAGAGLPVGTVIVVCSNQIPSNYLPLGTQYDTTLYPVLYALLGTDTTPTASALGLPTLSSGQYAIKATSGLSENAQDNVVAQLNEERSYSTEEVNTGKKWIDGKPIYRKVFTGTIGSTSFSESISIPNVEKIIRVEPYLNTTNLSIFPSFDNGGGYYFALFISNGTALNIRCHSDYVNKTYTAIVEYTKTT